MKTFDELVSAGAVTLRHDDICYLTLAKIQVTKFDRASSYILVSYDPETRKRNGINAAHRVTDSKTLWYVIAQDGTPVIFRLQNRTTRCPKLKELIRARSTAAKDEPAEV